VDLPTFLIAATALGLLVRRKAREPLLILGAAAVGLLLKGARA
jgi:hypothetical protein